MKLLEGKVAVITGASRGLGQAIARAYAREGAAVVLGARSAEGVQRLVAELQGSGMRAAGQVCDVSSAEQVEALARLAEERFGRIDIWVNNAGVSAPYGPTIETDPKAFLGTLRTNIDGTYHGSMAALKRFRKQGHGKLINMLGAGADKPAPFQNAYGSTKIWIRWFTRALAVELKDSGIEAMLLQPGLMTTDLINNPEVVEGYAQKVMVLETVARILGNPPEFAAEKALWMATAATDGKNGLSARAPSRFGAFKGLMRELWLRVTHTVPPARMMVREVKKFED
jgi:glucose 1-dehydrogenase